MGKWGGRRAARLVALCLATYGAECHLAGPMCTGRATTADHLIPRTITGPSGDVLANLRPACRPCNQARGPLSLDAWRAQYTSTPTVLASSREWIAQ